MEFRGVLFRSVRQCAQKYCVSVGWRMRDKRSTDRAARAGFVQDKERLPESFGHLIAHKSSQNIDTSAARIWSNKSDRLRRPAFCLLILSMRRKRKYCEAEQNSTYAWF